MVLMDKIVHRIEIRNREPAANMISTGYNTEVLLDEQPLKGVLSLSYEVRAEQIGILRLEMIASVKVSGNFQLQDTPKISDGCPPSSPPPASASPSD